MKARPSILISYLSQDNYQLKKPSLLINVTNKLVSHEKIYLPKRETIPITSKCFLNQAANITADHKSL